jgi:OmcA/MtrC family decaheme c-type cytochrome
MKKLVHWSAALMFALAIAGCGGGGGGGDAPVSPTPASGTPVAQAISSAAASAANDTSTNSSAPFAVVQQAGVPAVSVASGAPKVNFAVFSNRQAKSDLRLADVSVAIAKLVPGTNGNPDQWVNYIYRTETASPTVGPNGRPVLASARQATTDGKHTDPALAAQQLVLNADGYYTYAFRTDITNPAQTSGVAFEPDRTHRVALQLAYTNAAGEQVRVNPYYDFKFDAAGNAVPLTDPSQTRVMADVTQCNGCHERLAIHGGGRVDVQ